MKRTQLESPFIHERHIMKTHAPAPTQLTPLQALRCLIQHRRQDLSVERALSVLRHVLAKDEGTTVALRALEDELCICTSTPLPVEAETQLPQSNHPSRGFHGTVSQAGMDARLAWPMAIRHLTAATGECVQTVVHFLDSPMGRQFADSVVDMTAECASLEIATQCVVAQWMGRRVDPLTRRLHQLPTEVPYLVGWMRVVEKKSRS
jgi:hypothetical protein